MTFTSSSTPASARRTTLRRRSLAIVLALTLGASVAACGSDSEGASGSDGSETTEAAGTDEGAADREIEADPDAEDGAFPVTLEHQYGTTEITEVPERVVVVGLVEQDAFLAFGIVPVGVTTWFGGYEGEIWPWAQDELEELGGDAADITVLEDADGTNIEAVAALEPDVIVGLYSALTEAEYDSLSAIAPTVAQPKGVDYDVAWQETTRTVGKIAGKAATAEELIADIEAQFEEAKADHPEFEGATGAVATPYEGIYVYGADDPRGRFLESLGLVIPDGLQELAEEEFGGQLSAERADLLDVDVIIWLDAESAGEAGGDTDGVLGGPLYDALAVHTEGREVLVDSEGEDGLGGATSFVTVLSLPFLIDGIVPMMAAAIDGDPTTEVPAP